MNSPKKFSLPIRYILLPLLFGIIIFVTYLMNYLGAFKPVIISEQVAGPFLMIYKDHTGPYHKIVPVIEEVEKWAKENGFDCRLSFGEYLDNPKESEEARLRSHGGCLVQQIPANLPQEIKSQSLPESKYLKAVFEGSPGIGPMKVYPKVIKYALEQKLQVKEAVIEVYEIHSGNSMTTTYYFEVLKPHP